MRKFSIILVDDEDSAIRGIELGVNWDRLNIGKVYKAHSSNAAMQIMGTYEIDIVLTDIEMPNGNGLDLISWVKETKKNTVCMFYTGHAEFYYAQQAIKLGVDDYLLKPIPYGELERIILDAEAKILDWEGKQEIADAWDALSKEEWQSVTEAVQTVKRIIVENISEDISRDMLAASVNMTPNYLSRLFKKQEGVSLSTYIMEKRLAMAKQLLQKTDLPISIIADRVGIKFTSYMTKLFKEHENMSPKQYREQSRK